MAQGESMVSLVCGSSDSNALSDYTYGGLCEGFGVLYLVLTHPRSSLGPAERFVVDVAVRSVSTYYESFVLFGTLTWTNGRHIRLVSSRPDGRPNTQSID